jgi:hypothetical protein
MRSLKHGKMCDSRVHTYVVATLGMIVQSYYKPFPAYSTLAHSETMVLWLKEVGNVSFGLLAQALAVRDLVVSRPWGLRSKTPGGFPSFITVCLDCCVIPLAPLGTFNVRVDPLRQCTLLRRRQLPRLSSLYSFSQ